MSRAPGCMCWTCRDGNLSCVVVVGGPWLVVGCGRGVPWGCRHVRLGRDGDGRRRHWHVWLLLYGMRWEHGGTGCLACICVPRACLRPGGCGDARRCGALSPQLDHDAYCRLVFGAGWPSLCGVPLSGKPRGRSWALPPGGRDSLLFGPGSSAQFGLGRLGHCAEGAPTNDGAGYMLRSLRCLGPVCAVPGAWARPCLERGCSGLAPGARGFLARCFLPFASSRRSEGRWRRAGLVADGRPLSARVGGVAPTLGRALFLGGRREDGRERLDGEEPAGASTG